MVDFELQGEDDTISFDISPSLDTVILYVYEGQLKSINDHDKTEIEEGSVVLMDTSTDDSTESRTIELVASKHGPGKVLLFAGKKLQQPVAWHGPIVMNTNDEIQQTFRELRSGNFPPKRVKWDYKRIAAQPPTQTESMQHNA